MLDAPGACGGCMFGIGMQEIMLICVIALIVVGPKRLPELARALGKGYGEFRRAFDEMKRSVETDLQTEEIRRRLLDLPPPPPPPPSPSRPPPPDAAAQPLPLLTDPPAPEATQSPCTYPRTCDGSPLPEPPAPSPDTSPARIDGMAHG